MWTRRGSERCWGSFRVPHSASLLLERGFNVVFHCGHLPSACRRAHDEEIGHRGERAQIHDDNALGLLVESGFRRGERLRLAITGRARARFNASTQWTYELIIR